MLKLPRPLAIAAGCLALAAFGTTGVAVADGSSPSSSESNTENNEANEGDDDQGAQDAACEAAGIPTSASDINYDDETGVCTLGGGSDGPDED